MSGGEDNFAKLDLRFCRIQFDPLKFFIDHRFDVRELFLETATDIARPGEVACIFLLHSHGIDSRFAQHDRPRPVTVAKILVHEVARFRQDCRFHVRDQVLGFC